MAKMQAQLYGMQTQQGTVFRDLLVLKKSLGSMQAFFKIDCRRLAGLIREMPFSVRRVSYRSITLETVYLLQKRQILQIIRGKSYRSTYSMAGASP